MARKQPLKIIAGAPDQPLVIGDVEISCYVLEDETRVLVQTAMITALGMARGSASGDGSDRLVNFVASKAIKPFVSNKLTDVIKPVRFRMPKGGIAHGYPAILLADLCETVLAAREAGDLHHQQFHIAARCEALMRGFARVGIIALVDEATGYQQIRDERELARTLAKYLVTDVQPWQKTYPYGFYVEICRLNQWPMEYALKRPHVVGRWTNDMIYARVADGVLDELRKLNPRETSGERKWRHHQWFRPDPGYIKLNQHIAAVMALMRSQPNWGAFQRALKRAFPSKRDQGELDLGDE